MGTEFNFWITEDGATDITNTAITTMLAAQVHKLFAYWNAIIKIETVSNPWDFIMVWINDNIMGDNFYYKFEKLIKKAQDILYGRFEMVTRNLPSANNRTY